MGGGGVDILTFCACTRAHPFQAGMALSFLSVDVGREPFRCSGRGKPQFYTQDASDLICTWMSGYLVL